MIRAVKALIVAGGLAVAAMSTMAADYPAVNWSAHGVDDPQRDPGADDAPHEGDGDADRLRAKLGGIALQ